MESIESDYTNVIGCNANDSSDWNRFYVLVWRILAFGLDINANIAEMQSLQRCSDSPVRRQAKLLSKLGETVDHK